mmetsp:Transcript_9403/g.10619  ORF Transcript_9403/g.10619 Transcript_9403/m.10619 type:complete len:151 (-) Transcript_9403:361-813(-)
MIDSINITGSKNLSNKRNSCSDESQKVKRTCSSEESEFNYDGRTKESLKNKSFLKSKSSSSQEKSQEMTSNDKSNENMEDEKNNSSGVEDNKPIGNFLNMSYILTHSEKKKKNQTLTRANYSNEVTKILMEWFESNLSNPYPSDLERIRM